MKKALSFAVALGLVAGAASVASAADLTITGDARVRGVYHTNYTDLNDATQDKVQEMDQRYRLNAAVKVNDAVSVNTRLVFGDQLMDQSVALGLKADRANMVINTLGGTWTLGRQEAAWGNAPLPYLAKDVSVDRVKGIYTAGDMKFGAYLQKNSEGDNLGYVNGDGDGTTWGALVIGKAGDTSYGLLLNYNTSDTNAAKASGKDTGYMVDPYFMAKVGPATLLGELKYTGGDLGKRNDKATYGGYMAAVVGFEPVTLTGLLAYSKNGSVADSHFAPSLLIGKTNDTGMINFGETSATTDSKDRSYIVGAVASLKASDKVTVGALIAYLGATKHGVGDQSASLTEFDVTAEYELAQNAKYKIGIGYGDPSKLSPADDAVFVIGNSVEVAW